MLTTRVPSVFGLLYKAGRAISTPKHKSPVYWANRLYRDKLYEHLISRSFDAVVTSHLFPAEVLTSLKRENRLPVKTLAIATDYTCIPFWEETECDYYILPHKDLVEEFRKKQMPKRKIVSAGYSCFQAFPHERKPAGSAGILGLPSRLPVFLIMTGSMGYGRIEDTIQELVNLYGSRAVIVVICGNNAKLKESLENQCKGHPNVIIQGFTKKSSSIHGRLRRTVFKARRFNQHRGRCERRSLDPYRSHSRLRKQERCLFRKTGNVLLLPGTGSAGEVR